jgi:hypothetical protein
VPGTTRTARSAILPYNPVKLAWSMQVFFD